jgi:hypothetical protein
MYGKVMGIQKGKYDMVRRHKIEDKENKKFRRRYMNNCAQTFEKLLNHIHSVDSYITLSLFIRYTKNQRLVKHLIDKIASGGSFHERSRVYEITMPICSDENMDRIYDKIKKNIAEMMDADYFIQAFVRRYQHPERCLEIIDVESLGSNSNTVLSLLISSIKRRKYGCIDHLVTKVYRVDGGSLFKNLLLEKYGEIDTKYVEAVVELMKLKNEHNYGVNDDFLLYWKKEWLRSKSGRTLVSGFLRGGQDRKKKADWIDKHINLFWGIGSWNRGNEVAKVLVEYSRGRSRKKAVEMLEVSQTDT